MDREENDASLQLRSFTLEHADARAVARAINEAFAGELTGRNQRGNQASRGREDRDPDLARRPAGRVSGDPAGGGDRVSLQRRDVFRALAPAGGGLVDDCLEPAAQLVPCALVEGERTPEVGGGGGDDPAHKLLQLVARRRLLAPGHPACRLLSGRP